MSDGSSTVDETYFGQIALAERRITPAQLDAALERQWREPGRRLGEILVQQGVLTPDGVAAILRSQTTLRQPAPRRVGKYLLREVLGTGGAGRVYRAVHEELRKEVALKVLADRPDLSATMIERFRREATTAAALRHPNIVGVHDVGIDGDLHYIAMDLVEGGTLRQWLAARTRGIGDVLGLLEKVARAIEYAHRQGVLHRDLKPENILVRPSGEPVVVDFGLARPRDDAGITRDGAILGTPLYMAPEQVRGEVRSFDARTDVYALGVLLYEAVAGRPPFTAQSAFEIYGKILKDDPVPLRKIRPEIAGDLETICLKCLEKDPSARYPSAGELAEDLRRCRTGEPISAATTHALARQWRRIRRHPVRWIAAFAAPVLLAGVTLLAIRYVRSKERTDYARRIQSAHMDLARRLEGVLLRAEEARYGRPGVDFQIVSDADRIVAESGDATGVGDAYRGWVRFLVRDPGAVKVLEEARRKWPANPVVPLLSARCRLREYAESCRWPDTEYFGSGLERPERLPPPVETEEMRRAMREAAVLLGEARASELWPILPELRWILDLQTGCERYAAGDLAGAVAALRDLSQHGDAAFEASLLCAIAWCRSGDSDRAIAIAEGLSRIRPALPIALRIRAVCLRNRANERAVSRGNPMPDLEEARRLILQLSSDPDSDSDVATIELRIGLELGRRGSPAESAERMRRAVEIYGKYLEGHPENFRSRVNRAAGIIELYSVTPDRARLAPLLESARQDLDRARREAPDHPTVFMTCVELRILLCRRDVDEGRPLGRQMSEIREDLERLAALMGRTAEMLYLEGYARLVEAESLRAAGRPAAAVYREAVARATEAVDRAPRYDLARCLRVVALMRLMEEEQPPAEEVAKAALEVEEAAGLIPRFGILRREVLQWLERLRDKARGEDAIRLGREVVRAWERALAQSPDDPHFRLNLGRALLDLARVDPASVRDTLTRAVGELEPAIDGLRKAKSVALKTACLWAGGAYADLASAEGSGERTPEECLRSGLRCLEEALRLDPEYADALLQSARIRMTLHQHAVALEEVERYLLFRPESGVGYTLRGTIRLLSGDLDGAREDLDWAVAIEPQSGEARLARVMLWHLSGKHESCLDDLRRAFELAASDPMLREKARRVAARLHPERRW